MSVHYFNNTAAFPPPLRGDPGENYGPRCVPVPSLASGAASVYAMGVEEGERRAAERIVAWLRKEMQPCSGPVRATLAFAANSIERGEHRREEE